MNPAAAERQWTKRYPMGFSSSDSLTEFAASVGVRIVKLASHATPTMRLDLRSALHYVLCIVEKYEAQVVTAAQTLLKDLPPVTDMQFEVALSELKPKRKSAATKLRPKPRAVFVGGRGLSAPRHASPKRLKAGRRP